MTSLAENTVKFRKGIGTSAIVVHYAPFTISDDVSTLASLPNQALFLWEWESQEIATLTHCFKQPEKLTKTVEVKQKVDAVTYHSFYEQKNYPVSANQRVRRVYMDECIGWRFEY